jgi:hypothetical protein
MLIRPLLRTNQQSHRQVIAHESTLMTHSREPPVERPPAELTGVVEPNIRALLERRRADDRRRGWQDRLADGITQSTGSMRFVYLHLFVFGLWIAVNLSWSPLPHFDPSCGRVGRGHLSVDFYFDYPKSHSSRGR